MDTPTLESFLSSDSAGSYTAGATHRLGGGVLWKPSLTSSLSSWNHTVAHDWLKHTLALSQKNFNCSLLSQGRGLKEKLPRFSTLSLSLWIRDIMWNPSIFFSNVLCVSATQLQKLLFFLEPVMSLDPRKNYKLFTLHTPAEPVPYLFQEDFVALVDQKPIVIKTYAMSNKKCYDAMDNNLGDLTSSGFFCLFVFCSLFVVKCFLVHEGNCRNSCVSRTNQKTRLSLSIQHKLRNLLL